MKKCMTAGIFMLVILLMTACSNKDLSSSKQFELVEAYSQSFVRGKQNDNGGNSGTNYVFRFEQKSDFEVLDCWLGDLNMDYSIREKEGYFKLFFTKFSDLTDNENPQVKLPFEYDGQVLIKYQVNDKVKYYIIKDIERR
ncbi:MAG: hypothetical protein ACPG4Z_07310, partial [Chitinophagales bacterium]